MAVKDIELIERENDPQRLVEIGENLPIRNVEDRYDVEERDTKAMLAIVHNKSTPTAYLLFLTGYAIESSDEDHGIHEAVFGPHPTPEDVADEKEQQEITDVVKTAAMAELNERGWKLTSYELDTLSDEEIDVLEYLLDKCFSKYNIEHIKISNTPLGNVIRHLLRNEPAF